MHYSFKFEYEFGLGEQNLNLRSIVTVYRPPINENIVGGSSAIVVPRPEGRPRNPNENFYYNPLLANYMTEQNGTFTTNTPISLVACEDNRPDRESVDNLGQMYGTIFMYST